MIMTFFLLRDVKIKIYQKFQTNHIVDKRKDVFITKT